MKRLLIFMLCAIFALSNVNYVPVFASDENVEDVGSGEDGGEKEEPKEEEKKEEPKKEEKKKEEPKQEEPKKEEPKQEEPKQEEPKKEKKKEKEEPKQEEPKQEEPQSEEPQTEEPQNEVKEISVSRKQISFGTITEGDEVEPVTVSVSNDGNTPVEISWSQADSSRAFEVEALSDINEPLQPGDDLDFMVELNRVTPGDYTANILFEDINDSNCQATVTVTVKVKEKKAEKKESKEDGNKENGNKDKDKEKTPEGNTQEEGGQTDIAQYVIEAYANPEEGGTVSGGGTFDEGDEALLVAIENEGYDFAGWYLDGEKVSDSPSINVTNIRRDATFEAQFTQKPDPKGEYLIQAFCNPTRGGYVSGAGTFKEGESTILTAYANSGYSFTGWYLYGELVSKNESIRVNDIRIDATYTASFALKHYKIKVESSNEKYGTVSGGGTFKQGEKTIIKAKAKEGYKFVGWYEKGNLVSKDAKYQIAGIKANHTFKASFKPAKHTVKVSVYPEDAGTAEGSGKYEHGSDVKLTAKAKEGYVFKAWILNKQTMSTKEKYKLENVTKDLSITAQFVKKEQKTFKMTSGVSNKGGFISPSGQLSIGAKGDITYTIAPDNGYAIQEVSVDGKKVGPVTSYTFRNVTEDHTISVAFAPKKGNEKGVKKDKIITTAEAAKVAVDVLDPAEVNEQGRSSVAITPEMYAKMKEEGTLEEALKIPTQNVVGMDDAEGLPLEVDDYNYDEASGLFQILDITPDQAKEMIENGEDEELLMKAYEEGILSIVINNHYLEPGQEDKLDDSVEQNDTVNNMFEFISGVLNTDEEMNMLSGKKTVVTLGITKGEDFSEEDKEAMQAAGVKIDEYFYITVMKQIDGGMGELVTELTHPVELVLRKPEGSDDNCIIRLHNGEVDVLKDIDNNPETITIKTDRFSPYAFARDEAGGKAGIPMIPIAVGGVAILAALIIFFVGRKKA